MIKLFLSLVPSFFLCDRSYIAYDETGECIV